MATSDREDGPQQKPPQQNPQTPAQLARRTIPALLLRFANNDQMLMATLAVILGAAAGGLSIAFRYAIDLVQFGAFGFLGEEVVTNLAQVPSWRIVLAPTLGGLLIGLLVYRFMPNRQPQAVAHVIEASALKGGRMSIIDGFKAAAVSAASIGVGASVGREGPVVHLGASVGAWLAQRLHLGRRLSRTLLGCGVAAAIAASFNAPIAGVFFSLEVVIGHYALSAFAPIVIASVTGTIVSRMHYGDFPAFILPQQYEIGSFLEFPAFALLGVVSAVAAISFMRAVFFAEDLFAGLYVARWLRATIAGLFVGVVALAFPYVIGVGYEATDMAIGESLDLWLLVALIGLKIAATAACLGAGFGGGVFSPSLFIGAMLGGAFGIVATSAFPELSSGHGAYTLIGMGAVAGAVLGAPISTILMIFELTGDYALTIAVMIATAIATVITQQVVKRSFFTWQLERRGVSIRGGREFGLLHDIKIRSMADRDYHSVEPNLPLGEVRKLLVDANWGELLVVEPETRRLAGVITFADLGNQAFDTTKDADLAARDVMRGRPPLLYAEQDLEEAIRVFTVSGDVHVPVVEDRESRRLVGLAHEHEVMAAYHRALVQARREERGED
jgi:CIC family chloride channel protein